MSQEIGTDHKMDTGLTPAILASGMRLRQELFIRKNFSEIMSLDVALALVYDFSETTAYERISEQAVVLLTERSEFQSEDFSAFMDWMALFMAKMKLSEISLKF